MAWTAPATVITGDLLTAALWNAQVRDNMLETAPAVATAAGLPYADAANSLALLAASGNGGKFLRFNAGATAVEAAAVGASASALEWANKLTDVYEASFAADGSGANPLAGPTALAAAGWAVASLSVIPAWGTAIAGDTNSAADNEEGYLYVSGATGYGMSPRVIGGWARLQALGALKGQTYTTCTVTIIAKGDVTTANANDCFGLGSDSDALVTASGMLGIIMGATNFEYRLDGAAGVSLAVAKDTDYHKWEFVMNFSTMRLTIKIDGTARASDVVLIEDVWPKGIWLKSVDNVVDWRIPHTSVVYS